MPSTRDIRRRIKSVRNTAQITKAMQMVASSKMRKAQLAALAGRPFEEQLLKVLREVTANAGDYVHPLMTVREVKQTAVVLVSTDKGLCGSLNTNLMREAVKYDKDHTLFIAAGRKASQFLARTKRNLVAEFNFKDTPQFSEARTMAKFAGDLFLKGEVDQVDVVFTRFVSTLTQKPQARTLLPIGELADAAPSPPDDMLGGAAEFLFEPSAAEVFEALLPQYLNFEFYQILLDAKASEHSARMVAMKNATENAQQLIKDLTLEFNKIRQASITNEILEISSAAMALE